MRSNGMVIMLSDDVRTNTTGDNLIMVLLSESVDQSGKIRHTLLLPFSSSFGKGLLRAKVVIAGVLLNELLRSDSTLHDQYKLKNNGDK